MPKLVERKPIIDTGTLVPIAFVLIVAGFVYWFSALNSRVISVQENYVLLSDQMEKIKTDNNLIIDRMARMETKLDILIENIKR